MKEGKAGREGRKEGHERTNGRKEGMAGRTDGRKRGSEGRTVKEGRRRKKLEEGR